MNASRITSPRLDSWLESAPVLILILAACLVLGSGCGQSARTSNPDEGRKALETVLDAWKSGAKPDTFAQRSPTPSPSKARPSTPPTATGNPASLFRPIERPTRAGSSEPT